jgi:hypothetical protein
MAQNTYTNITGLWEKDTKRGKVLSAKLSPASRQKLLDALADPDKLLEAVVFVNDRRDKDSSPSHNLVLVEQGAPRTAQEPREAPASPQGRQERDRGPVERESSFPAHPGVNGAVAYDDPDNLPF